MIKPDDIGLQTCPALDRNGKESGKEIRAGIQLTCLRRTNENADDIELAEQFCKFEVWHGLYGDIERALHEMQGKVLFSLPLHQSSCEQARKAIDDVLAMVRNPFRPPWPKAIAQREA
jgi:hypothetical protein